jgi:hypothetical protein
MHVVIAISVSWLLNIRFQVKLCVPQSGELKSRNVNSYSQQRYILNLRDLYFLEGKM